MPSRFFVAQEFAAGTIVALPAPAARHVQVLRLQPGAPLVLFNGTDGRDWPAEIVRIARGGVDVRLGAGRAADRELPFAVTLALAVPANDRMDALVEKAGELGAAAIQPLVSERSVLRLAGERAEAKRRHWSGVAAAASEQSGRTRVTAILALQPLAQWLAAQAAESGGARKVVLSFAAGALAPGAAFAVGLPAAAFPGGAAAPADALPGAATTGVGGAGAIVVLSGPEGGLTDAEEDTAVARGFVRVGLGPRVLRADTAPLALLAWLGVQAGARPPGGR